MVFKIKRFWASGALQGDLQASNERLGLLQWAEVVFPPVVLFFATVMNLPGTAKQPSVFLWIKFNEGKNKFTAELVASILPTVPLPVRRENFHRRRRQRILRQLWAY